MSSTENSFSRIPYVGSRVSLVSNSGIRYVGTLYTIDPRTMTVALKDVSSLGTENRYRDKGSVQPSDHVYPFIIFHGPDIVDLQFLPQPPTSASNEPSYPPLVSSPSPIPTLIPTAEQTPFRGIATKEHTDEQPLVEERSDSYVTPINTQRGANQPSMFRQLSPASLPGDELIPPGISSSVSHGSLTNGSQTVPATNKNDHTSRDNESSPVVSSSKAQHVPTTVDLNDNLNNETVSNSETVSNNAITTTTPTVPTPVVNQQTQVSLRRPLLRAWGPPPVASVPGNSKVTSDNANGKHSENVTSKRADTTSNSNMEVTNKKFQSRPDAERKFGPPKSEILQRPDRHGTVSKNANPNNKTARASSSTTAGNDSVYTKGSMRRPTPPGLRKQGHGIKVPKEDYDFEAMRQTFEKTRLESEDFPPIEVRYDKSRSFFDELVPENEMRGERNAAQQRAVDYETFGETGMRPSMRRKVGMRGRGRRGYFGRGRGRFRGRENIRRASEGVPSDGRHRTVEE